MISGDYPNPIKNGVKNIKLAFDQETMWKEIEARIQRKKRRKILVLIPVLFLTIWAVFSIRINSFISDAPEEKTRTLHFLTYPVSKDQNRLSIQPDHAVAKPADQVFQYPKMYTVKREKQFRDIMSVVDEQVSPLLYQDIKSDYQISQLDSPAIITMYVEPIHKIISKELFLRTPKPVSVPVPGPVAIPRLQNRKEGFIYVYAGLGFVSRKLSNVPGDDLDKGILARIRATETVLEQKTAGITWMKPVATNLYFFAGLDYSQITDKFQFNRVEKEEIGHLLAYQSNRVKETRFTRYNSSHFLDIHVAAGYIMRFSKYNIVPSAGISYGLVSSFEGTILSQNQDLLRIKKTDRVPDIWNLRISTQFQFDLLPGTKLTLSPQVSLGLNDVKRPEGVVSQRLHTYSLSIGLLKGLQ